MERPAEVRAAFRRIESYVQQLERDLATERRARQKLELKLKAAQAARPSSPSPAPRPAPAGPRQVLGLEDGPLDEEAIRAAFRARARECHPDVGGTPEEFIELGKAQAELLASL